MGSIIVIRKIGGYLTGFALSTESNASAPGA
jgi:hypothetical protein